MPKISRRTALTRGGRVLNVAAILPVAGLSAETSAPQEDVVLKRLSSLIAELRKPPTSTSDNDYIKAAYVMFRWIVDRLEDRLAKRGAA